MSPITMPSKLQALPRVSTARKSPRPAGAAEAAVAVVVVLLLRRQVVFRLVRRVVLRVVEERVELLQQLLAVPALVRAVLGRLASYIHL